MDKSFWADNKYSIVTVAAIKLRGASLAQLAEHALRKRTVVGSIPTGGFLHMANNKKLTGAHRLHQLVQLVGTQQHGNV